jgi:two-component system, OmpR family, sensor kinase
VGIRSVLRAMRRWALTTISVRLRLALWYGALMTLTLTLFSLVVFAVAQLQLESSVDQGLQGRAQLIAHTLQGELLAASEQHQAGASASATPNAGATVTPTAHSATPAPTGSPRAAPTPTAIPTPVPTADPQQTAKVQRQLLLNEPVRDLLGRLDFTFEVLNADGRPAYYAPNIASTGLPLDAPIVNGALLDGTCGAYTRSQHASLLRIYVYPVTLPAGSVARQANAICQAGDDATIVGAVVVAKTIDDVSGSLATLRQLLIVGVIIAVLCTSLGGWLIASSGLRPVTAVTRTARAIAVNAHAAGLGRRVGYTGPRDEVGELASTFDDMLAAIERVAQAQRRFVADASHELRAPLTTIKGSLEFLARAPNLPLEERSALVEDAYTEADRMATLVNDLLLLARADAAALSGTEGARLDDQMRGRRELVELDQLALDLFRHARAQLQARHKTQLHFTIDNLEPVTVLADPGQLRQVLLILLDNAIKYTPTGGKVRIAVRQQGGRAAISVTDTGIGIDPEDQPHIFERFYRSDKARDRDQAGSGLGLAIAKWIVEAHGGEIVTTSQPGRGSTFTLLLPAQRRPGDTTSSKVPAMAHGRGARKVVAGAVMAPLQRLAGNVSRPHPKRDAKRGRETPRPTGQTFPTPRPSRMRGAATEDTGMPRRERADGNARRAKRAPRGDTGTSP